MPSIEILCSGSTGLVMVGDLPFAVRVSPDRKSDRSPDSRFQADFFAEPGVLYHLGNPGSREGYVFFAYALLDHSADDTALVFVPPFRSAVQLLLERLMEESATNRLLFTSDWQFGPDESVRCGPVTLAELWAAHDAGELVYNAAYTLRA